MGGVIHECFFVHVLWVRGELPFSRRMRWHVLEALVREITTHFPTPMSVSVTEGEGFFFWQGVKLDTILDET